ncbi:MAG: LysR family transcriptional regulator [Alphaproteobacteria bacterium]|nr:LysR family transcriptional regulator [Alphaproteobacteria bacterium]
MNLSAIQTFLTVVRTGNLNRASEQLNVTQSTVTARLDSLEAVLGQPLLLRSRKGAVLTKAGFAFQRHAEAMLHNWDLARRMIDLPKGYSDRQSLACEVDLWVGFGDVWLAKMQQDHPDTALEAWPGTVEELRRWLVSGLVDAAVSQEPLSGRGFSSTVIAYSPIVLVSTAPPDREDWQTGYVHVDHGAEFRRWYVEAFPDHTVSGLSFGSASWALAHIVKYGGSAYLPLRMVPSLLENHAMFLVADAPIFSQGIYFSVRDEGVGKKSDILDGLAM